MKKIHIEFEDWQLERLQPLFDLIEDANKNSIKNKNVYYSLLAQVFPDGMVVQFLDGDKTRSIRAITKPEGNEFITSSFRQMVD